MMLCFAVMLPAMWWLGVESQQPGRAHAVSMAVAFMFGQLSLRFVPRAIHQLPVSQREIWRAGWIVATLGATAFTFAAKVLSFVMPSVRASIALPDILLSTVYDFSAAGISCGLVIVATRPRPARGPFHYPWPIFKGLAEITLPLGLMVGVYVPMWLSYAPPAHWTALGGRAVVVLLAALALTVATYFHSPGQQAPANRAARPSSPAAVRQSGRFAVTGLPRLLIHEYAWTAMIGAGLAAGAAAFVIVVVSVRHGPQDLFELLTGMLLMVDGNTSSPLTRGTATFNLLLAYAFFAATVVARFPAMVRHLRALPLGTTRLNALLLAWPSVIWLSLWAALALLHYAVLGTGLTSVRADIFVAVVGFSALVQSLRLRLTGTAKVLAFCASGGVPPLLLVGTTPPAMLALAGAVSLTAAALINRQALLVASTYRKPAGALLIGQN
jgi:hypothetical protein